jgi:hypothetical protein
MNKEAYKQIGKAQVKFIELEGKKHYYKIPSYLDVDLFGVMQNKKVKQKDKMLQLLVSCITDGSGVRIFESNNKADTDIVKGLGNDIQIGLINAISDILFPSKSKAQV